MENFDALSAWWVYVLSAFAGAAGFAQNFPWEDSWLKKSLKFLGRITVAMFAGLMSFHIAKALGGTGSWIFVAVGIGAWRGDKGLQEVADSWDEWRERRRLRNKPPPDPNHSGRQ